MKEVSGRLIFKLEALHDRHRLVSKLVRRCIAIYLFSKIHRAEAAPMERKAFVKVLVRIFCGRNLSMSAVEGAEKLPVVFIHFLTGVYYK